MNVRKALGLSLMWVVLALIFNAGIYVVQGPSKALEFLTGYLVELSLSVDNIFVFLLIFSYFKVPPKDQAKILFWGILGAQLMRGIFIFLGVALLNKFDWLMYGLGAFLVFTGVKLFIEKDKEVHPEQSTVLKITKKYFPNLSQFWIVLIMIETTDLIFAMDSIPAILAITKDPFIVYSSNIFAILGLRAMYFALAGLLQMFHHLHYALGVILTFVGLKMLLEHYVQIPIALALAFIAITLLVSVVTSLLLPRKDHAA
jgi:tellurite resistance protein TerC